MRKDHWARLDIKNLWLPKDRSLLNIGTQPWCLVGCNLFTLKLYKAQYNILVILLSDVIDCEPSTFRSKDTNVTVHIQVNRLLKHLVTTAVPRPPQAPFSVCSWTDCRWFSLGLISYVIVHPLITSWWKPLHAKPSSQPAKKNTTQASRVYIDGCTMLVERERKKRSWGMC